MEDHKIIGQNIHQYRKMMNKSQQELSEYLGISREEVSYYETGTRIIPTKIISAIAKYFGVDEFDLYEADISTNTLNMAFAFRAEKLSESDIKHITDFKKIALNYLKMQRIADK
jgi:transcriptional regulator with XRE-family HTH domain